MRFTHFVFEYYLNCICDGNKSRMARDLDIFTPDLYRIQGRLNNNGDIGSVVEVLFQRIIDQNVSLDYLVGQYMNQRTAMPLLQYCDAIRVLEEAREEFRKNRKRMLYFGVSICDTIDSVAEQIVCCYCNTGRCPKKGTPPKERCLCELMAEFMLLMCSEDGATEGESAE